MKFFDFIKFKIKDSKHYFELRKQGIKPFREYGLTLFTGRQGAGKTMSLVHESERLRNKYNDLYICSNFGYIHENESLSSLTDIPRVSLFAKENNYCGVLILWDEIQNDFDSYSKVSKDVLRVVTQQRKQGVKILGTSQVFGRVSKALREQTYEVVMCRTIMGRYTKAKYYNADDFIHNIDKPEEKVKMYPVRNESFIQTDELRNKYDSYAVIRSLQEQSKEENKNKAMLQNAFNMGQLNN